MADGTDDTNVNNNDSAELEAARAAAAKAEAEARAAEAAKVVAEEAEQARLARMTQQERDADMVAKLVQDRIDSELAPVKGKLEIAFKQRDEALKKLAELEQKEKEAKLRQLEEEGKHKEVADLKLAEANARIAALERQNTELSRDVTVREALKSYVFRNDKAADMAFKEIVVNLVQDEHGAWKHRSGISVRDYCEAFSKSEEQSFLFKPKANSGSGTNPAPTQGGTPESGKPKSLFDLTQDEVLKMAREGKLGAPR